ncbi:MAG: hypothetical protein ACRCUS_05345 [Anaerovoracaceae bacterium]
MNSAQFRLYNNYIIVFLIIFSLVGIAMLISIVGVDNNNYELVGNIIGMVFYFIAALTGIEIRMLGQGLKKYKKLENIEKAEQSNENKLDIDPTAAVKDSVKSISTKNITEKNLCYLYCKCIIISLIATIISTANALIIQFTFVYGYQPSGGDKEFVIISAFLLEQVVALSAMLYFFEKQAKWIDKESEKNV